MSKRKSTDSSDGKLTARQKELRAQQRKQEIKRAWALLIALLCLIGLMVPFVSGLLAG